MQSEDKELKEEILSQGKGEGAFTSTHIFGTLERNIAAATYNQEAQPS